MEGTEQVIGSFIVDLAPARTFVPPDQVNYFDLEDPVSLARLDQPLTALRDLSGLVVIDEVQRRPDLFPILCVLVDRAPSPAKFLILGSAAPGLLRQSSESLAGRLEVVTMGGFSLAEAGRAAQTRHWQRGGLPLSFLASSEEDSLAWRKNFIQTFLERDLAQFGIRIPPTPCCAFGPCWPITMGRFGMGPSWPAPWAPHNPRCGATWTPWSGS